MGSPMDVDTTWFEKLECKVSYRGRQRVLTKEFTLQLKTETKTETKSKRFLNQNILYGIFIVVLTCLVSIPLYDKHYYNRIINVKQIETDLKTQVHFQEGPINRVLEGLNNINNLNGTIKPNLLLLMGTMGVGKTHTVNIIKSAFKSAQIHHINLKSMSGNLSLHRTVPYLLILDNLQFEDVDEVKEFVDTLPKLRRILIICVFNVQTNSDNLTYEVKEDYYELIPNAFNKHNFTISAVRFNSINARDVVEKYKTDICNGAIKVIENYNFKDYGFKGLSAKLSLINCDKNRHKFVN